MVSSIPLYAISRVQAPKATCSKVHPILNNFWWEASKGSKLTCLRKWESICKPKELGGHNFTKVENFNNAFVANYGWSYYALKINLRGGC